MYFTIKNWQNVSDINECVQIKIHSVFPFYYVCVGVFVCVYVVVVVLTVYVCEWMCAVCALLMCVVCAYVCIYLENAHVHRRQMWHQVSCFITLCLIPFRQTFPELEGSRAPRSACLCLTILWLESWMPLHGCKWLLAQHGLSPSL